MSEKKEVKFEERAVTRLPTEFLEWVESAIRNRPDAKEIRLKIVESKDETEARAVVRELVGVER